MILHINTKDQKKIKVSLRTQESTGLSPAQGGKVKASLSQENEYGSQVLLPLIEKILKQEKLEYKQSLKISPEGSIYKDLKGIKVETGPGSFTGLRVGVSVANALGFSLRIPVNGKKIETELLY